jgi:hypothetical protein
MSERATPPKAKILRRQPVEAKVTPATEEATTEEERLQALEVTITRMEAVLMTTLGGDP